MNSRSIVAYKNNSNFRCNLNVFMCSYFFTKEFSKKTKHAKIFKKLNSLATMYSNKYINRQIMCTRDFKYGRWLLKYFSCAIDVFVMLNTYQSHFK